MKSLIAYLLESQELRKVVIYGGKFQPFHKGHYEIYEKLVKKFGKNNVFIVTADLNKRRLKEKEYKSKHIFTFDEKLQILDKMFGIPAKQVIKSSRNPFMLSWKEMPMAGEEYIYISVCGTKDAGRFDGLSNESSTWEEYDDKKTLKSNMTHKYYYMLDNEKVHLSATEVRNYFRGDHSLEDKKKFFEKAIGKYDEEIFNLVNDRINYITESTDYITESVEEEIISEGGVNGHIQHLHNDLGLTFEELEEIIDLGFSSNLEQGVEKVDGNPLAMTYRDGEFLFAYQKEPKNINDLELEFMKDLPKKIYRQMCERLIKAFKDNENLDKWFSGNKLLHMEILSSEMPNMIKYNRDAIVFHYMVEYDNDGNITNRDRDLADEIALQMINSDEQIEIVGPPRLKLKDIDFTEIKNKFKKELGEMLSTTNLEKSNTLFDYISTLVNKFCKKNGAEITDKQLPVLTKKWLGLNKTHQFTTRTYKSQELVDTLTSIDKKGFDYVNDIYNDVKVFIASICVSILKNMEKYVAKDPADGSESIKRILNDAIKELQSTGELSSSERLSNALKRIEKLGMENLFPSEGILFNYKGRIYKITGMFADYNVLSKVIRDKMKNQEYSI